MESESCSLGCRLGAAGAGGKHPPGRGHVLRGSRFITAICCALRSVTLARLKEAAVVNYECGSRG